MHALYFCCIGILLLTGCRTYGGPPAVVTVTDETKSITELSKELNEIVSNVVKEQLTLKNSEPGDQFLTKQIRDVEEIAQKALVLPRSEASSELSQKALAVLDALQQRRVYRYMLWAERTLEESSSENYPDLNKLSQDERIRIYEHLSEINLQLIPENMLTREIVSRLAEIYDTLDAEHKKAVRVRNIHRQADPLSKIKELQRRRSFDDF